MIVIGALLGLVIWALLTPLIGHVAAAAVPWGFLVLLVTYWFVEARLPGRRP